MEPTHKKVVEYLTPMLGEATANNLLRHYCARTGVPIEEIRPSHLSDLAIAMTPMLAVWLGTAGANRMAHELGQLADGGELK